MPGFGKLSKWQFILMFLVAFAHIGVSLDQDILVVATYNLWNVMFNWDVRKLRIVQMVRFYFSELLGLLNTV